jgi:hypothetical protein
VANEVNKAQKLKKLKDEQKAKAAAAGKASEAGSTASSGATSPATGEDAGCCALMLLRRMRLKHPLGWCTAWYLHCRVAVVLGSLYALLTLFSVCRDCSQAPPLPPAPLPALLLPRVRRRRAR